MLLVRVDAAHIGELLVSPFKKILRQKVHPIEIVGNHRIFRQLLVVKIQENDRKLRLAPS